MPALRTGAAALVIGVLLSGCSQDPQPRINTAPSPSATTSAPPAPSPSVTDPASETAEQFIERWLAASVVMQNSGSTAAYEAMSTNCQPCRRIVRTVQKYYAAGGFIKFDGQQLLSSETVPSIPEKTAVRAVVDARPTAYKASATSPSKKFPGGTDTLEIILVGSVEAGWLIDDYVQIAP